VPPPKLPDVPSTPRPPVAVPPEDVLAHIETGADVIVPMANGEPVALVDALEANHERLEDVRLHQMHALHERPYIHGKYAPSLRHVSYFLAPATREAYWSGGCDLVPNHFSELPALLRSSTRCSLVIAAATVDHVVTAWGIDVVTEWGIAELRGRPLAERARALIAIAHPDHRERARGRGPRGRRAAPPRRRHGRRGAAGAPRSSRRADRLTRPT
jgi:acyl-CoA hydrolase